MVEVWQGEAFGQGPPEVQGLYDVLEDRGDDGAPPWTANREPKASGLVEDKGGGHGRERRFTWMDGIGFTADEPVRIGRARFGTEIIHFIIQDHTRARGHHGGAEGRIDGEGQTDGIAPAVDHAQMACFVVGIPLKASLTGT